MNEDVRVLETVTNKQVCVMSQQGDVIGKGIKIIIMGVKIPRQGAQAAHMYHISKFIATIDSNCVQYLDSGRTFV